MDQAAVFTGDLIGSTKVEPVKVDLAMAALRKASMSIGSWEDRDCSFTRFRGDGWQIHIANPKWALRAALLMTAELRGSGIGLSTRISIGTGTVDRLGVEGLSGASGEAFTISGHGLDHMPKARRITIAGTQGMPWEKAVVELVEWVSGRWTREQAEAVSLSLGMMPWPKERIAKQMGISRQALEARLKGSGLASMSAALAAFEGMTCGGVF